jgi:hypothetical protein
LSTITFPFLYFLATNLHQLELEIFMTKALLLQPKALGQNNIVGQLLVTTVETIK